MKKILFIAPKYSIDDNSPYLTNDLAEELALQAIELNVVAYGEEQVQRTHKKINERVIKISSKIKIVKYFLIWPRLFFSCWKLLRQEKKVDQIVMFGPLTVMWPAAFLIKYFKAAKKTAIIFDIFPIHQVKIGSLPSFTAPFLKFFERALLANFTEITAMGENNKRYIERYYETEKLTIPVKIMPLWGRGEQSLQTDPKSYEEIRIIFGGQVIKGREIEVLIHFLEELRARGLALSLDLYSKGADFEALKLQYASKKWLHFKNQLPRNDYFKQLSGYHVGAIVTDRQSDLPTFPSKIIDYLEAGLQVYCLVEKESDLHSLGDNSVVYINSFCFSAEEIERSLYFFKNLSHSEATKKIADLRQFFSVEAAALRLVE